MNRAAEPVRHSREGGNPLPQGWICAQISDVALKGEQRNPHPDKAFTYVDIGSIDRERKIIFEPQQLMGKDAPSRARKVITCGDVLVSLTRPNLNAVALVAKEYDGQIASTGFEVIKPTIVDSRFVFALVRSKHFIDAISGSVQGALYPAAKSSDVQGYEFSLPPLAEQKVIADKLDELLALVESTKARLDAIPAILKSFRQSVLAAAVSGKLTEEWRGDNGCEITQSDIQQAFNRGWETEKLREYELKGKSPKNDSWKNKLPQPYLPTPEEQKLFNDIPSEWEFVSVNQLTRFVKDGPHFSPKYSESGVPFISGRNITINGVDFTSAKYISEDLHIELSKRCKPELGDILLTKGGTTGTACVNKYDFDFNVWVHVAVLRVTDENIVNPEYLSLAFNSPDVYSQSQSYTHGVANRDLGLKRMIKICFPIPHIKEQTEIVRRVEELFAFADKVEAQVNAAQQRVNNLTQSILAKAFRGELTADWRAANPELISGDNSASALLKRIKAEREALAKATQTAKTKPIKNANSRKNT
ncbi:MULTISPECIES: restriction endonuclease subunit S [unclassified Shewanella]|uniref:restriction endonuclease subunit S n=1 Tax=unclassified Shewanella TaxID=196818 RepID=UPI0020059852|nr:MULTISPECIES: restriction endonuclease subunit S [unclassified Shewanella]MCK7634701.1 restriction endonuclease subunit S [Shewanella sp. JNE17]MCK7649926.1 restriction endonuclease subunit S [Shewanella sp. JNE8]MCK7658130.1 restriction endonuclease subunit S [Shewanella sp. JNE4-2]UPO30899.1 restriction endonuclease subunit S [Shewanella sp. JNE2]